MAEILIKAISAAHSDTTKDQRGCYKRGMPVVVMPDGHPWGLEERLPKFAVLKIPLISVAQVEKYIAPQLDLVDPTLITRRRLWRVRWDDLPASDRNTIASTGQLVIKATAAYTGPFDRTWAQVKSFFRNELTGLNETADL